MTSEKLKVSRCENGILYAPQQAKNLFHTRYIFCGVLLFILIVSLFFNCMFMLSRLKILENEVDSLKRAYVKMKMLDDDPMGFEGDDLYEDDETEEPEIVQIDVEKEYAEYDAYDQNINETDESLLVDVENKPLHEDNTKTTSSDNYRSASVLTKDIKDDVLSRDRRNVIGATEDGVLVNAEPYALKRKRNRTEASHSYNHVTASLPAQQSEFGSHVESTRSYTTRSPPIVYNRQSRVMHHDDKSKAFRQIVKKSSLLKSGGTFSESYEEISSTPHNNFTIINVGNNRRRYRQGHANLELLDERHPRVGRIKPLPSIHYGGDTSRYVFGQHSNFNGNGHLKHNQRTFIDWKASDWVKNTGMASHFEIHDGVLTIKESGIYFVYAQIYYLDVHDSAAYRVYKNADIILHCTVTTHSTVVVQKGNTCYTAGVEHLSEGDTISVADVFEGRYSLFEPGKSFFGVIKLGDIRLDG